MMGGLEQSCWREDGVGGVRASVPRAREDRQRAMSFADVGTEWYERRAACSMSRV